MVQSFFGVFLVFTSTTRLTELLLPDSFPLMNYSDSSFQPRRCARVRAAFEIALASGIVSSFLVSLVFAAVFGRNRLTLIEIDVVFLSAYMMAESAVTFLILWMLTKARQENLRELGICRRQWKIHVLLGILAAPCLVIVSGIVGLAFQRFLPEYALGKNPLMEMISSPRQLALFILVGILAGGVKEELQRAFILCRFRRHLGGAPVGLVLWSLAFGAGHYVQGVQGMCAAAILGLVFGVLYIVRGNLILTITAHAAYNTMTLLIYWFVIGIKK
jgi:membrane protease YdiL (CAAX protease family)